MSDTTLRIRPVRTLHETLEKVARERSVSYRRLLQHLIRQALRQGYQPKNENAIEEQRVESRIPLSRSEKNEIRALIKSCQPKLTPEEWVFEIMENYEQFLEADEEQDDRKRAGVIFG